MDRSAPFGIPRDRMQCLRRPLLRPRPPCPLSALPPPERHTCVPFANILPDSTRMSICRELGPMMYSTRTCILCSRVIVVTRMWHGKSVHVHNFTVLPDIMWAFRKNASSLLRSPI